MTALGNQLRNAREKKRFSIQALAQQIDVNKNTLGAYERGERLPDIDVLKNIAVLTETSFVFLVKLRLAEGKRPPMVAKQLEKNRRSDEEPLTALVVAVNAELAKIKEEFNTHVNVALAEPQSDDLIPPDWQADIVQAVTAAKLDPQIVAWFLAVTAERLLAKAPSSRAHSQARTKLDEAVLWLSMHQSRG